MPDRKLVGFIIVLIGVLALGAAMGQSFKPRAESPEAPDPPSDQARDLYFASDSTGQSHHPGLRVKVYQALEECDFVQFSPRKAFRGGDKVRFGVEANSNGYLYIIQRGTSGATTLLYPHKEIDGNRNRIQPTADYRVPKGDGWFVFDENPVRSASRSSCRRR